MDQRDEALVRGYRHRYFFPHHAFALPKCGPDGFKQAKNMCGKDDLNSCWEIVLYAISPVIDEFPQELFFDSDVMYHEQQFGRVGQIATVNLFINHECLFTMNHQSDLVQRISRRRDWKTRVETVFKGWNLMLWNAILNFAQAKGVQRICSPTADVAMANTALERTVQPELFERLYNRDVHRLFQAEKQGNWWCIDLKEHDNKILTPHYKHEDWGREKTICICHDIERGMGHLDVDPAFAELSREAAPLHLSRMLEIEKDMGVRASYNVVGSILEEVKEEISQDGHCLGFHSYDHMIGSRPSTPFQKFVSWCWEDRRSPQLQQCRKVDRRLKGYRTPR